MTNGAIIALEISKGRNNVKRENGKVYIRGTNSRGLTVWHLAGTIA